MTTLSNHVMKISVALDPIVAQYDSRHGISDLAAISKVSWYKGRLGSILKVNETLPD